MDGSTWKYRQVCLWRFRGSDHVSSMQFLLLAQNCSHGSEKHNCRLSVFHGNNFLAFLLSIIFSKVYSICSFQSCTQTVLQSFVLASLFQLTAACLLYRTHIHVYCFVIQSNTHKFIVLFFCLFYLFTKMLTLFIHKSFSMHIYIFIYLQYSTQ